MAYTFECDDRSGQGDVDRLCQEFEELRPHMSVSYLRYAITKIRVVAFKMVDVADAREKS